MHRGFCRSSSLPAGLAARPAAVLRLLGIVKPPLPDDLQTAKSRHAEMPDCQHVVKWDSQLLESGESAFSHADVTNALDEFCFGRHCFQSSDWEQRGVHPIDGVRPDLSASNRRSLSAPNSSRMLAACIWEIPCRIGNTTCQCALPGPNSSAEGSTRASLCAAGPGTICDQRDTVEGSTQIGSDGHDSDGCEAMVGVEGPGASDCCRTALGGAGSRPSCTAAASELKITEAAAAVALTPAPAAPVRLVDAALGVAGGVSSSRATEGRAAKQPRRSTHDPCLPLRVRLLTTIPPSSSFLARTPPRSSSSLCLLGKGCLTQPHHHQAPQPQPQTHGRSQSWRMLTPRRRRSSYSDSDRDSDSECEPGDGVGRGGSPGRRSPMRPVGMARSGAPPLGGVTCALASAPAAAALSALGCDSASAAWRLDSLPVACHLPREPPMQPQAQSLQGNGRSEPAVQLLVAKSLSVQLHLGPEAVVVVERPVVAGAARRDAGAGAPLAAVAGAGEVSPARVWQQQPRQRSVGLTRKRVLA